ncbi:acetyl-CoA synthetase-like protein [Tilletiaria anomala UBC 951]|uniref:Acetyl-CoA synthetase-like protein n=1 Tax=Tilletiaria anomala (strain ATCC 24038 / CBS 436.72 / UBC 951) TaxID=1037660 RepID=A0A066W1Z4_TILAU|nr:acetyl-CoA synthetase-like protein [Tilletiaria anomala UBC 951]KDN47977.1 acetyl-CoA synthetase-like protein [Tilletiaria anomala UBC 951]
MAPQIITCKDQPAPQWPRCNVFELIASNPNKIPDSNPAFIRADGKELSRGQLFEDSKRLAHAFVHKLGLNPGDRVGILSPNSCYYPIAVFANFIATTVSVPLNPGYGADELIHPIQDSGTKYLLVHPSVIDVARQAVESAGQKDTTSEGIKRIWILADDDEMQKGNRGEQDVRTLLGDGRLEPRKVKNPEETNAFIAYSSGTTGKSKGTELTHHNMTSVLKIIQVGVPEITHKDIHVGVLPFQHIFAISKHVQHAPYTGTPVVVLPKFDLEQWLSTVQHFKVTIAMAVPPILVLLAKHPIIDKYNLSSLKLLLCAAAPLSAELGDEVEKRIPTVRVTQGWGLTETSPTATFTPSHMYRNAKGSAGRLLPGLEMRIVDDDSRDVGHEQGDKGKPGEIWVRGPTVFRRYLNNKVATDDCKTSDGWFKTGDVGIYLKEQIYIVDRKKELIKYKGYQVVPSELEALLLQHPEVADAAVLGVYSKEEATEFPRAHVVPRLGLFDPNKDKQKVDEFAKEIYKWTTERVANHKRLRGGVKVVESVPKSPSGKILRRILRDQAAAEGNEARARL